MANRKFLQVPLVNREDERAVERVSKALRRTKADAARFLFHEADKKIRAEIKRASIDQSAAVNLTTAGEQILNS